MELPKRNPAKIAVVPKLKCLFMYTHNLRKPEVLVNQTVYFLGVGNRYMEVICQCYATQFLKRNKIYYFVLCHNSNCNPFFVKTKLKL